MTIRPRRRARRGSSCTAALSLVVVLSVGAAHASSRAAPELIWSDRPDAGSVRAVELRGGQAVALVSPEGAINASGAIPNRVRVYDRDDGALLWEGPDDLTPTSTLDAVATSGVRNATVFMAGTDPGPDHSGVLRLRAARASDGSRLWGVGVVLLGAPGATVGDLVRFGPRLFLVGGAGGRALVRAVATRDGSALWDHRPEIDEDTFAESASLALFERRRLYVAGTRDRFPLGEHSPVFVRRYHATRGRLQWESELGAHLNRVTGMTALPLWLIVATESYGTTTGSNRWVVYGLNIFNGSETWKDHPFGNATSAAESVTHDRLGRATAFAAGWVDRGRTQPVLRAYDAATGELLWQRVGAGVREGAYRQVLWTLRSGVIVVGEGRLPGESERRALIQAFDPADGTLLWSRPGAAGETGGALTVLARRNAQVAAGGHLALESGATEALLHLYRVPELIDPFD